VNDAQPSKPWQRVAKALTATPVVVVAGLFGAYLAFAYFAVDPLAKRLLPWVAETRLASRASVGRVAFDPLRLALHVEDLRLSDRSGGKLASLAQFDADLQFSGLFKWAWYLRNVRLVAPVVRFDIAPGGHLNWADLIAKVTEDKTPSDTVPRVLIERMRIERGDIEYTDRNRPVPFRAVLEPLAIELDGLSTLPEDRGDYLIAARLPEQGGTLRWKGEVGLNPVVSSGDVALEGVKLVALMRAVKQADLPLRVQGGAIRAGLHYDFALVKDKPRALLTKIAIGVSDVTGTVGAGRLALQSLAVNLPRLDFAMDPAPSVRFAGLGLSARGLSLADADRPLLALPQVEVHDVGFDLAARRAGVGRVALLGGTLAAARDADGVLDWQRLFAAKPAADAPAATPPGAPFAFAVGRVEGEGLRVAYDDRTFRNPLAARLDALRFAFALANPDGALRVTDLTGAAGPFTLHGAARPKPLLTLRSIALADGRIDPAQHTAALASIVASGLTMEVWREPGTALNWLAAFEPAKPAPRGAPATGQRSDWKAAVARVALTDAAVHVEDRDAARPVVLDVERGALEMRDFSLDLARPLPLKLGFAVRQGGRFDAHGRLAPSPLKGALDVRLDGLALKPFAPYVSRVARLNLDDGAASLSGRLTLVPGTTPGVRFAGGFAVERLAITEEDGGAPFLGWERLASDTLDLGLAPNRLHMTHLEAKRPFGKLIIHEDKTLNLKRMLRAQPAAADAASAPPPPAAGGDERAFPVTIEQVRVADGELEFADLSLSPQFGTRIHTLGGVINGLSSDATSAAQVELDGRVDEFGSARIRGQLQPFRVTDFTDLKLVFRNLEMTRLSPYSGKFAGRRIESGKLSVDLEYKIKDRQLAGENQFIVNRLRLGERVESPDALKLPLDLAIALLEDSNGVIELDLPVSGSLDDPQFSYGRIIWKAIVNVLTKLVTAPFRALGSLLGISADKLEAVGFDPGSAALLPPEHEKLLHVAKAMAKRPALMLTITPAYDPVADTRALKEAAIRSEVARRIGMRLAPGQAPGPVDLANPRVREALQDMDDEAAKRPFYKKLARVFDKPKDAYYAQLLEKLTDAVAVGEPALVALATARGEAIRGALVEGGVAAERLQVAAGVKADGAGKAVSAKLGLGVKRAEPAPAPLPVAAPS
jgi:hypothetical protein